MSKIQSKFIRLVYWIKMSSKPVNKKSGFQFKQDRDRKNKLREDVLRKTSKIDSIFKKSSTDVNNPIDKTQQRNEILQSNCTNESCIDLMRSDFENNVPETQCYENDASETSSNPNVSNAQIGIL